jgi:hypothetical protein
VGVTRCKGICLVNQEFVQPREGRRRKAMYAYGRAQLTEDFETITQCRTLITCGLYTGAVSNSDRMRLNNEFQSMGKETVVT